MATQDTLADFLEPSPLSGATTPLPDTTMHEARPDGTTPPPPSSKRGKSRTPTPTMYHISTPPPTIDASQERSANEEPRNGTIDIATASAEELRNTVTALQAAVAEAKMSAAHYKLQYTMLSQSSSAALERMAVEARMAQSENDAIHVAGQARAPAPPSQPPALPQGTIPVHKDLYQRMQNEIKQLQDANRHWERTHAAQEKAIGRQEAEIATLSDKVTLMRELMRERIRETREHLLKFRSRNTHHNTFETGTLRTAYSTPQRSQGLEALLQASELTNPELRHKKPHHAHTRNAHSISSLPTTPQRVPQAPMYATPANRQSVMNVPATAPMPRTSAMGRPLENIYRGAALPVSVAAPLRAESDQATVSASDEEGGGDSEAETEILEPDEVGESQASRAAGQILRASQDTMGSGGAGSGLKQAKLFGEVRKTGVERVVAGADDVQDIKRRRVDEEAGGGNVGLGISGVRA